MDYDETIKVINEIEKLEEIIITTPKYKRCCYSLLELCKALINYAKIFLKKSK